MPFFYAQSSASLMLGRVPARARHNNDSCVIGWSFVDWSLVRQEPNNSVYLASSLAKSVITLNTTTYILPCQSNHYIIKVQSCKSFPTLSCGYLFYISQDLHSVARALRDKNQDPSNKGWESRFRSLELTIHNTQQEINDDSSCSQLNWQQER